MESWASIIVAVCGVISLADLLKFFFVKQDRKAKDVENKDSEIAAVQHANGLLAEQLERGHETISRKDEQIDKLQTENASLKATQSCLFDDMCIHKGCRIRKPHQGQGQLWYENYRNDPSLGADYHSIDTLIKMDRANRLKLKDEPEEAAADEVKG